MIRRGDSLGISTWEVRRREDRDHAPPRIAMVSMATTSRVTVIAQARRGRLAEGTDACGVVIDSRWLTEEYRISWHRWKQKCCRKFLMFASSTARLQGRHAMKFVWS